MTTETNAVARPRVSSRQRRFGTGGVLLAFFLVFSVLRGVLKINPQSVVLDAFAGGLFLFALGFFVAGILTKRETVAAPIDERIMELKVKAGKLDHRGEWDEALQVYEQILQLCDESQAAQVRQLIQRTQAKKLAARA